MKILRIHRCSCTLDCSGWWVIARRPGGRNPYVFDLQDRKVQDELGAYRIVQNIDPENWEPLKDSDYEAYIDIGNLK